jgi:hypothetical protein
MIQVFAHIPGQEREAMLTAAKFDADSIQRAIKTLESSVPRGTRLVFGLTMPGLRVDDPEQSMRWWGKTESVQFGVSVPEGYRLDSVIGTVRISQDWIPIGKITFKLKVAANLSAAEASLPAVSAVGDVAGHFEMYFVSYASEDRKEVLKRVQGLQVGRRRTFMDVLDLEPGERWKRSLYRHIDESDVVVLFWSKAAKRSKWVRKEIRYAIRCKHGDDNAPPEITPLPIEGPPGPKPWKELARLHSGDLIMSLIAAEKSNAK